MVPHPFTSCLHEYRDWYNGEDGRTPPLDDLALSPEMLRAMYVVKGTYASQGTDRGRLPAFYATRMPVDADDLAAFLDRFDARVWNFTDSTVVVCLDADAFFEYIGAVPLGLDAKWPSAPDADS